LGWGRTGYGWVFFYLGFTSWATYDIFGLKMQNADLVEDVETGWGFGQILPVVLLAIVLFNVVDAVAKKTTKIE
jgi:hypothetical protein